MLNRIDILDIIKAHLKTLRSLNQSEDDNSIFWGDILTFFLVPILCAAILYWLELRLLNQISNLIAIISIFGGFLFNLLAIIYTFLDKIRSTSESSTKKRFANEINANISFCILLSVILVVLLLAFSFFPLTLNSLIIQIASSVVEYLLYFLLTLFFLTLLMILSRVFTLLEKEGKENK